jgi:hypothetical protein
MVAELEAIFDRLARADEHLEAIQAKLLAYYNLDECSVTGKYKPNPDGLYGTVEDPVVSTPAIEHRLNTLIGEFLHDTRSSLDHLARQLVLSAGGKPTRGTKFPLCTKPPTDDQGQRVPPGIAGGISAAAQTVVGAAQPYHLGANYRTHPLWRLDKLWNIDKHRDVIAKGSHTAIHPPVGVPAFSFTTRLESTNEHGARLRIIPDDPTVDVDAYTTVEIAIYEPEDRIEGPLFLILEQALQAVEGITEAAEATCF